MNGFALWIAQGFGLGRIPFAPGTFGSLAGVLWTLLLVRTGSVWLYLAGTLFGLALSVWLCSVAERILKQKDASSIVLDEIAAVPICFLAYVASEWARHGHLPIAEGLLQPPRLYLTLVLLALFRVFDIAKVWPASRLERWPGGWGITADDAMAAAYVALLSALFVAQAPRHWFRG
jgi:phosphatidylglycerophosphatase A